MRWLLPAAVTACMLAGNAMAADYSIKFAHSLSTSEPAHLAAEFFARNVTERSQGRLEIEVFPGEQLGSGKEVNEMIRQGANVMNLTDAGYLSDFVPDVGVLNGPYLVKRPEDFKKILASDWYQGIDGELQEAGFRVVAANGLFGARHVIADKPVRTPADIEGMTVRVPPNQMWIATFEAMGARPTTVNWAEVYSALAQNVVAAAEAPLGSLWGSKLFETRKTISMTGHFLAFTSFVASEAYFQSLPEDLQTILLEEGLKAGDHLTRLTLEKQDEYVKMFEAEGVTFVTDVDVEAFQEATASVYDAFPDWTPGLHDRINAILQ